MSFNKDIYHEYYSKEGDFVEYFYVKEIPPYYAEPLDTYVTLLKNHKSNEIIGIQIQHDSIKALTKRAKKETKKWFKTIRSTYKETLNELFGDNND